MDAFARFLAEDHKDSDEDLQSSVDAELFGLDEVVHNCSFGDDDHDNLDNDYSPNVLDQKNGDDDEVVLEDWRPPSPETISGGLYSQYEEEYD